MTGEIRWDEKRPAVQWAEKIIRIFHQLLL